VPPEGFKANHLVFLQGLAGSASGLLISLGGQPGKFERGFESGALNFWE